MQRKVITIMKSQCVLIVLLQFTLLAGCSGMSYAPNDATKWQAKYYSNPSGAEIYVDGQYVGITPIAYNYPSIGVSSKKIVAKFLSGSEQTVTSGYYTFEIHFDFINNTARIKEYPTAFSLYADTREVSFERDAPKSLTDAIVKNDLQAVSNFIDKGSDVNKKSKNGITPLFVAIETNNIKAVKMLLKNGATPNTHSSDGRFPLIIAAVSGYTDIARELLKSGADPNMRNNVGTTALIWAAAKGYIDIVKLLLENNADATLTESGRSTALDLAIRNNYHTIAEIIRSSISKSNPSSPPTPPSTPQIPSDDTQKWAVIIGISNYQQTGKNGLNNLIFADNDAKDFANSLRNLGWSDSHIKLLTNKEATQRNIMIGLESWLSKAGPNDQIILFWAGHGFPDPEDPEKVYFACYDTDISIPATGYRMDNVRRSLEEKKARNVVLLADTCHAGKLITRSDGSRGISIVPNIKRQNVPKGWVFMVGADTDRQAIEHSSWSNGAFTHSLIKGLNGEADGFQSAGAKDGIVTMGELKDYINISMPDETQRVLGVAKRPVITTSTGDPDIWNLNLQVK